VTHGRNLARIIGLTLLMALAGGTLVAEARDIEDLPGRWQAAVLAAERRAAGDEPAPGGCGHCCH